MSGFKVSVTYFASEYSARLNSVGVLYYNKQVNKLVKFTQIPKCQVKTQ